LGKFILHTHIQKFKKITMSETALLIQIFCLLLLILGYLAYLYNTRRKIQKQKREENKVSVSNFSGNINAVLEKKSQEKREQRTIRAKRISNQDDEEKMTHSIPLAADIQLLATDNHLLIKGSVQSIAAICDEFATMEQLPQGYCVQLGD
jgi:hypothetical protein